MKKPLSCPPSVPAWIRFSLVAPALLAISACGGGGSSRSGGAASSPAPAAPAAPSGLQASAGNKQVALSWTGSTGATSYSVKRGNSSGGPYSLLATLPGTSFLDIEVSNGTPCYYVVTALNGSSESAPSKEATATPTAPQAPGAAPLAPASLQASPGDRQVSLTWPAVAGATSYAVGRAMVAGGPYLALASVATPGFVDLTVQDGTAYYYVVTALNGSLPGPASPEASTTPLALPVAPASPSVTLGDGQVSLSWTALPTATGYQVGRSQVSGGPYTPVATPSSPRFQDAGLSNGTTYYYVVTASNPVGPGAASPEVAAMPVATPTDFVAIPHDGEVGLFWAGSLGATGYKVYEAATTGASPSLLASPLSARYLDAGLADGSVRNYRVTALNATGEGTPSAWIAATPSASATPQPPPEDSSRNLTGLGTWFLNDWDGSNAFVDAFLSARVWQAASDWHQPVAGVDADGWPTADASTVILTGSPAQTNGTYKLMFNGQATLGLMWCGGSIANQSYDAASNTTSADVTFTQTFSASMGLIFTQTQRTAGSAVGTGFSHARLYRPGYPTDGSVLFTTPFLNAFRAANVKVVRMMDWDGGSSDMVQHWADRSTPSTAGQCDQPAPPYTAVDGSIYNSSKGMALEYRIQLCNTLQSDFWINIPPVADADFITKTAQMIAFGSDGSNPYTRPQAHPVFPPLDPTLKVYVEYANETWNSAGGYSTFFIEEAICKSLPASHPLLTPAAGSLWYTMWRWPAYNIAQISETFRGVFGSAAMMTRIRPVLETQEGDGQDTLGQALRWLASYAATLTPPRRVADLLYGGGGAAYYGVVDSSSAVPDQFFAPGNYPDPNTLLQWGTDALLAADCGIKHVAYEGGPGLAFSDGDNRILNADPRMVTYMHTMHDAWSAMGGDLATYYCVEGPSNWECTPDITQDQAPKLRALAEIAASPRAALALGPVLPGKISLLDTSFPKVGGGAFTQSINGEPTLCGIRGTTIILPGHTPAATAASLSLHGCSLGSNTVEVWINGVDQGSLVVPVSTGSTLTLGDSASLKVNLPAGVVAIRLVNTGDISLAYVNLQ